MKEEMAMKRIERKDKSMKKTILSMFFVLAFSLGTQAQIFLMTKDESNRADEEPSDISTIIPEHFVEYDQENDYVPLGSGIFALAGLGFGYLLAKKRKQD